MEQQAEYLISKLVGPYNKLIGQVRKGEMAQPENPFQTGVGMAEAQFERMRDIRRAVGL